jgi:hypothetical protein
MFANKCMLVDTTDRSLPENSAASHLLEPLGIPGALHCYRGSGGIDVIQLGGRQSERKRSDIFVQTVQVCGARDRH